MNESSEKQWQDINPSDWRDTDRAAASEFWQQRALAVLGDVIPDTRDAAMDVIGTAWDQTPDHERSELFYLSGEFVGLSWDQIPPDKAQHVLMVILGFATDFSTAFQITHGYEYSSRTRPTFL